VAENSGIEVSEVWFITAAVMSVSMPCR
jgi:hypothetical protein